MGFFRNWVDGFKSPDQAYKNEVRAMSGEDLQQREAALRRSKLSGGISTVGATGTLTGTAVVAAATSGLGAPAMLGPGTAVAVSGRRLWCTYKKHRIVKKQMKAEGVKRQPINFARDIIVPTVAGIAGTVASIVGADIGFTDTLVTGATTAMDPAVAILGSGHGSSVLDTAAGFTSGVHHAADQAGQAIGLHPTPPNLHTITDFQSFQNGFTRGVGLVRTGVREAIAVVAPGVLDTAFNGPRAAAERAGFTLANQSVGAAGAQLG